LIAGVVRVWRVKLGETVGHGSKKREWENLPLPLETSEHLRNCFQYLPSVGLILLLQTVHDKLGTPKGEPIASGSDDLLGGVAPVRGLVVKVFHAINT